MREGQEVRIKCDSSLYNGRVGYVASLSRCGNVATVRVVTGPGAEVSSPYLLSHLESV